MGEAVGLPATGRTTRTASPSRRIRRRFAAERTPSRTTNRPPARASRRRATRALLEVLDRDGHVRQVWPCTAGRCAIGRALDNDVVLTDPHVAAHHFSIDAGARAAWRSYVGETRNGVVVGTQRLARRRAAPAADARRTRRARRRPHAPAPAPAGPRAGARAAAAPASRRASSARLPTPSSALVLLAGDRLRHLARQRPDEPRPRASATRCWRRSAAPRSGAAPGRCSRRPSRGRATSAGTCACSWSPAWPAGARRDAAAARVRVLVAVADRLQLRRRPMRSARPRSTSTCSAVEPARPRCCAASPRPARWSASR